MCRPHLAALALALSFAGLAHAGSSTLPAAAAAAAASAALAKASVLYDQSGGKITGGAGAESVNRPPVYVGYDTQAADDFTVPAGATWLLTQVEVFGFTLYGSIPASSHNITVYKDQKGLPGKVVADFPSLVGVDTDGGGSYKITLPSKLKLGAGVYWISVQANTDPTASTVWNWQNLGTGWGQSAVFRNPGEGYGAGCGSYTPTVDCYGFAMDLRFVLRGTVK